MKHFRHAVEGRTFTIYTDHKPLTFALHTKTDRYSPREIRHLDYISQFTTDIQHISGSKNVVADALSRINSTKLSDINFADMAKLQDNDPEVQAALQSSSLDLQKIPLNTSEGTILCDLSTGHPRPIVPREFRRKVFNTLHDISHPGIRATTKLVASRYVWPKMNSDVRSWARQCLQCQTSKVHRHIHSPMGTFSEPDARFSHVHLDIVGPLPPSQGYSYLLTCVDRFTRWPEAIPIAFITAESICQAFVDRWVSLFGCPSTITTDRGQQFESSLFNCLISKLGCKRDRTTAYHPAANGMVERFHCQLKASLRATDNPRWTESLPLVLLGIRNAVKADLQCTPSELVFGTTLRLPGEFISPTSTKPDISPLDYAKRLSDHMGALKPTPPRLQTRSSFIDLHLQDCTHVFVRCDAVRKPLQAPYNGPFKVLERKEKFFLLDKNGKQDTVSIDRLKPAYLDEDYRYPHRPARRTPVTQDTAVQQSTGPQESNTQNDESFTNTSLPVISNYRTTRSGRLVRFPTKLADYIT